MDEEITGNDFNACLAQEYQRRTGVERDVDMEWVHAGRLARKGYAAMNGNTPEPTDPAQWNVAPGDLGELQSGRERLMAALGSSMGGRDTFPCACAKAQVYYDGWVEQSHDNDLGKGFVGPVQPDFVAAEKAAFMSILPKCEGQPYVVYFGWDRYDLTSAAVAVIDQIAADTEGANVGASVRAHTDTSGSNAYNQRLSEKRANTVSGALGDRGVAVLDSTWAGETELAKETGDGVREPLNRRAVVKLMKK
jgi:OOP family OmpA-OmpF porin